MNSCHGRAGRTVRRRRGATRNVQVRVRVGSVGLKAAAAEGHHVDGVPLGDAQLLGQAVGHAVADVVDQVNGLILEVIDEAADAIPVFVGIGRRGENVVTERGRVHLKEGCRLDHRLLLTLRALLLPN